MRNVLFLVGFMLFGMHSSAQAAEGEGWKVYKTCDQGAAVLKGFKPVGSSAYPPVTYVFVIQDKNVIEHFRAHGLGRSASTFANQLVSLQNENNDAELRIGNRASIDSKLMVVDAVEPAEVMGDKVVSYFEQVEEMGDGYKVSFIRKDSTSYEGTTEEKANWFFRSCK